MASPRPPVQPVDGSPAELANVAVQMWDNRPESTAPTRGEWGHRLAHVLRALARTPDLAMQLLAGHDGLVRAIRNEVALAATRRTAAA